MRKHDNSAAEQAPSDEKLEWESPVLFPLDLSRATGGDAFDDEGDPTDVGSNDADADFPS